MLVSQEQADDSDKKKKIKMLARKNNWKMISLGDTRFL